MRRLASALILVLIAAGHACALDSGSIPAAQQPVVKEKIGSGKIVLEASVYPEFTELAPTAADPWCTAANPKVFDYLTGKDILTKSNSPNLRAGWPNHENDRIRLLLGTNPKSVVTTEPWPNGRDLDKTKRGVQETDLKIKLTGKEIPAGYRKTAKILVTWTMRIEGECPNWHIGHFICEPYNGGITFVCPEANVRTWLHATYDLTDDKGNVTGSGKIRFKPDVIMQMPRTIQKSKQSDPTLTGTYVITAEDFKDTNGQIPANLTLKVSWKNESALYIWSPDKMRSIIVNVIPYTKSSR